MNAIIFDMDDTLYNRLTPFSKAYTKMFGQRFSIECRPLRAAFTRYGDEVFEDSMNHRISMEDMYVYRIQKALADFGEHISREEALAFQTSYGWFQNHIELSSPLTGLMEYCSHAGVFLGIITNGPSTHQRDKCRALGVEKWIAPEHIIASGDIGINKPDPEIFSIAARRWNLDLERTWYVGDSYEHDVLCPHAVGWQSIWLDRKGRAAEIPDNPAALTVHTEEELFSGVKILLGV
ncbi:MAG: HAD family hydrolase [Lachnospiraceae bacterium]|nr:HAD family hydrolase [Lachnospiraceae bacterium]